MRDFIQLVARPEEIHKPNMDRALDCLTGAETRRNRSQARSLVANRNQNLRARSWVYFAQRGEGGPVKIGRTRQLSERMYALQSTCPERVVLLGRLPETDISEDRIHAVFNRHRIRGEWFHPAPEILELATAGERIYAAGYCREIPESLTDEWLTIRRYADQPRTLGPPSAFDLVSARIERLSA